MDSLPKGFSSLDQIQRLPIDSVVDVIGIVCSYENSRLTKKGGTSQNIYLQGPGLESVGGKDLRVSFLVDNAASLPKLKSRGDILLLRQVKVKEYLGRIYLSSIFRVTTFLVFPHERIPDKAFTERYMGGKQQLTCEGSAIAKAHLHNDQELYVINLNQHRIEVGRNSMTTTQSLPHGAPSELLPTSESPSLRRGPPGIIGGPNAKRAATDSDRDFETKKLEQSKSRGRLHLVQDVMFGDGRPIVYVDLVVELLKKFDAGIQGYEILVSDYTWHPLLYDRQQLGAGAWTSHQDADLPIGKYTLKIIVMSPHKEFINDHVRVGDLVLLRDVKLGLDNHGHLAGDMWPDDKFLDKVQVQTIFKQHDITRELRDRKEAYQASRPLSMPSPEKPVPELAEDYEAQKAATKRAKNQRKKEAKRAKAQAAKAHPPTGNKNVKCSKIDVDLSAVRFIRDLDGNRHLWTPDGCTYHLPFINVKYRAMLQVLDFHPPNLEDFAIEVPAEELALDDEASNVTGYEWAFQLLVQDANVEHPSEEDKMILNVGHAEAQFLLGDLDDPEDLRKNTVLLARLRERLFILWGDLEERKRSGSHDMTNIANQPFEACISEYGTLNAGGTEDDITAWTRQYMLNGVAIV